MITGASIGMFVIFLLGAIAFGSSKVLCIIGMVLSLALVAADLIFLKDLPQKTTGRVTSMALAVLFIFSIFTGMSLGEGGLFQQEYQIEKIRSLIEKGKTIEAREGLEDFQRYYGKSDNSTLLETLILVEERRFGDAVTFLKSRYDDSGSVDYYSLLESIYIMENNPNNLESLRRLYLEAAQKHPDWAYMQKRAGMSQIDNSNFIGAEYALLRAYEMEPTDYEIAYYLGVACYGQGRRDAALVHFDEAVRLGADKELSGYMAWYLEQITK